MNIKTQISNYREAAKRVKTFTYLGSTLADDGELGVEVTHRMQSGWKKWKRMSVVLCDSQMNVINEKVYRTMVRQHWCTGQRHER